MSSTTHTRRLYLVLSAFISSFCVVSISRGSSLKDSEISCTGISSYLPDARLRLDVSELLYKHLKKYNTVDVVSLRGVTSNSDDHKRASRFVCPFVAFIYFSIICFGLVFRSLTILIADELLRAGDVELNPGPPPQTTPECAPTTNTPSSINPGLPQSVEASNMSPNDSTIPSPNAVDNVPVSGQVEPLPATDDQKLSTKRELIAPEMPSTAKPLVPKPFQSANDEDIRNDLDEHQQPPQSVPKQPLQEEKEPQLGKSLPVKIDVKGRKSTEETTGSEDTSDFGVLHRSSSCLKFSEFKDSHIKRISTSMKRRHSISDIRSLDNDQIKSLISVNRLLRLSVDPEYCPMCCEKKQQTVNSHIFPSTLLTVFKRIHCSEDSANKKDERFIYDFSRGKRMHPRNLTYPMLCDKCEKVCDEKSLRELYIYLMDKPKQENFKIRNRNLWFQRVLANIMFRGLLVADSLPDEFQDADFKRKFKILWAYCARWDSKIPDLRLFLLPNQPLDEKLIMFLYAFEYVLRCPMFSEVFREEDLGIKFIYTKFDCFHLILPLDDKSETYFNHFLNGFETYKSPSGHMFVDLRWTVPCVCKKDVDRDTKAIKFSIPREVQPLVFPEVLLKVGLQRYGRCVSMIYCHSKRSKLTQECKIMLEYLPGLNHQYPTKDFRGSPPEVLDGVRSLMSQQYDRDYDNFNLPENDLRKMIINAAQCSPLGMQQRRLDEQQRKLDEQQRKLDEQQKVIDEQREKFTITVAELEKKKWDLCEVKSSIKVTKQVLTTEIKLIESTHDQWKLYMLHAKEELDTIEQKLKEVHSLLIREKRERIQCVVDNVELKKQSVVVENNLYDALCMMSARLKRLQNTGIKLCTQLLRQCDKMKAMIMDNTQLNTPQKAHSCPYP